MIDWGILNIAPTKDKNIIKEAYRRALTIYNPEEDAKKFMELRYAYESALKWASSEVEIEEINSIDPLGDWLDLVDEVYFDFEQRLSLSSWDEVFQDEICEGIESRMDARDALLNFLMEHNNIPQSVWIEMDKCFSLLDSRVELYDVFPKDFIDNVVVDSIMYPDIINYDLFNRHARIDYDKFIDEYFSLEKSVRNVDIKESEELIEKLESYGNVHPYFLVQKARHFLNLKEYDKAYDVMADIYEKFNEDKEIVFAMGDVYFSKKEIEKAKECYKKVVSLDDKHYYAKVGLADCFMEEEEYIKAKEMYNKLRDLNKYDAYIIERIKQANESLIKMYEKQCKKEPNNDKVKYLLGWCYLENNRTDDAIKLLKKVKKKDDEYEYYYLQGQCYLFKQDSEKAISAITTWIEIINDLKDDGTDEYKERKDKLSYAFELLAKVYDLKGDKDNALVHINMALKEKPDDIGHLELKTRFLFEKKKYKDCVIVCDKIIESRKISFIACYYRGMAMFYLKEYGESYDSFEEALKIHRNHLETYLWEIKILLKFGEFDKVRDLIEYIKRQGVDSDTLQFYSTKTDYEEDIASTPVSDKPNESDVIDYAKYRAVYIRLLKDYEDKKSDIADISMVYYEIASTYMHQKNYEKALEYSNRVVAVDKENIEAYTYIAFIYENMNEYRKAIEINKKIIKLNPTHYDANNRIAEMLEKFCDYEEAVKYHTKQLEITQNLYYYMCRGLCYLNLDKFDLAREDFESALDYNDLNPHPYNNIGASYQYEGKYSEAIEYYEMAVDRLQNEPTPLPYRNMAVIYQRIGNFERAVECLRENIALFNDPHDYEQIAKIFYRIKRFKESIDVYTKRCKLIEGRTKKHLETSCDLYIWVGKCNLSLGAEKTAFKYFNKAIEEASSKKTKYIPGYLKLASLYRIVNNYDMAIKCFDEVNGTPDIKPLEYADYAYCLINANDYEVGKKYVEEAIENINKIDDRMLGQLPKKYSQLGYCYAVIGEYEKAKDYFEKALSHRKCNNCTYSKCTESLAGRAFLLERQGKLEEALALYEEALRLFPSNTKYIYGYKRVVASLEKKKN